MGICCTVQKSEKEEKEFYKKTKNQRTFSMNNISSNISGTNGHKANNHNSISAFIQFNPKFKDLIEFSIRESNQYNFMWFSVEELWNNQKYYIEDIYKLSDLYVMNLVSECLTDSFENNPITRLVSIRKENSINDNLTFYEKVQLHSSSFKNSLVKHKNLNYDISKALSKGRVAILNKFIENKFILLIVYKLEITKLSKLLKQLKEWIFDNKVNFGKETDEIKLGIATFDSFSYIKQVNSNLINQKKTEEDYSGKDYYLLNLLDSSVNSGYLPYILINLENFTFLSNDRIIFIDFIEIGNNEECKDRQLFISNMNLKKIDIEKGVFELLSKYNPFIINSINKSDKSIENDKDLTKDISIFLNDLGKILEKKSNHVFLSINLNMTEVSLKTVLLILAFIISSVTNIDNKSITSFFKVKNKLIQKIFDLFNQSYDERQIDYLLGIK